MEYTYFMKFGQLQLSRHTEQVGAGLYPRTRYRFLFGRSYCREIPALSDFTKMK